MISLIFAIISFIFSIACLCYSFKIYKNMKERDNNRTNNYLQKVIK